MIRLKRLYAHDFKQLREVELSFPDAGRILVQGKNEAGKSTLFEAVYFALFGKALTTESGGAGLDDLIGYEKEKARVELDLVVGERLFKITRTLIRNKPNKWELDIVSGENIQQVRGSKSVNDRLVSELGFDAEALLNTCFVEQKKLEKLEGLGKAKREESLAKLLNLERLLELEEKLKLRGEDEKMLARLIKRVELAETQDQLPTAESDLQEAEQKLKLIQLRAQVERAAEEKRAALELGAQFQTLSGQREQMKETITRVNALDKARQQMGTALDRFDFFQQQTERLESMRREREETDRAVRENVPALQKQRRALARLARHLTRLNQIEEGRGRAAADAQRLQDAQQELDSHLQRGKELNAAIAQHEARANELETKLRDYDIGDALGEWATLAREANAERDGDQLRREKQGARDELNARVRQTFILLGALVLALAIISAFLLPTLAISTRNLALTVIVGVALALVATILALLFIRRVLTLSRELSRATEELGKIQGESSARREIATTFTERLKVAEARLSALGVNTPASPDTAQARRVEIAASLENKTHAELGAERDLARENLNYARAQRDDVVKRIEGLQPIAAAGDLGTNQRKVQKAERILNRWRPLLARRAAELGIGFDIHAARDALREAEGEIKSWQTRIKDSAKLAAQIAEGETRLQKTLTELQTPYESARALLNGVTPPWDSAFERVRYEGIERQLEDAFEANGGERARANYTNLEKEISGCDRELKLRQKTAQQALVAAHALLDELGVSDGFVTNPTVEELDELATKLGDAPLEEKSSLEQRVKSLGQRVAILHDRREKLERELGLQGEVVEIIEAREELEKARRDQEERKYGAELVLRALKRIMQKILPATMDYMRRILPQITRDRYHDAELDPETYKIKVWDERAGQSGAWKEKNIFSGGTKDQFSLALRLAFALATLPQERGTSPGFIFLDEPLGSFDEERAAALLYLLTEGEIGRAFDQIFLISHVRVQEDRFTHQLRLENGVVVESNL